MREADSEKAVADASLVAANARAGELEASYKALLAKSREAEVQSERLAAHLDQVGLWVGLQL